MPETIQSRKPLPTGTVTFLFSDIEGSTERWERHREAMRTSVRRHEEIVRSAISRHDGYVFKTIGDAFCAAFFNVAAAIAAALDAQRALRSEDWSHIGGLTVRMAVHTGFTDERDGDYFGPAVNRVARLLSIGHGGQVLVSGASADLAQGEMPSQAALRDLGAHRLKDLIHPEQVYQLVAPDLPYDFPPLRSLEALPNNLPLQLTSFVGRDIEILSVTEALAKTRLLTLVGSGGVGKTRLSLQVGAELLDRYDDGVWLVELAPLNDGVLIPSSVASLFHITDSGTRSLTDALVHALRPRRALLIFDNCEHLVEPAARLIDLILRSCPHIRILATSRQGLGIAGETVHRVASLAIPPEAAGLSAETALSYGAVALFVERAMATTESFRLTDQNAAVVSRLCRRLDGIALAIELAAPRLKALSVEQLEAKLDQRFRLLTGGSRTALPRQQTMRALVDWSYELLSDDEKMLFRRVAVFAGGWSLDAANEICSDDKLESWMVLDHLQSLVDKSMVVAELSGSEQRYRLLESTRQYAYELLNKSGELEPLQSRLVRYFRTFADKALAALYTTPTKAWLAPIEADYDNIRGAIQWGLLQKNDVAAGASIAAALRHFFRVTSNQSEGRNFIDTAISLTSAIESNEIVAAVWLARATITSGVVAWQSTLEWGERALALCREVGYERGVLESTQHIAEAKLRMRRHDEAAADLDRAMSMAQAINDQRAIGYIKAQQARNFNFQKDYVQAQIRYTEALAMARASGEDYLKRVCVSNLAEVAFQEGDVQAALERADEVALLPHDYIAHNNRAAYLLRLGRLDEARADALKAIRTARDSQFPMHVAISIQHLAGVAAGKGAIRAAARLMGYCGTQYGDGDMLEYTERYGFDQLQRVFERELDVAERQKLLAEGSLLSEEQAVAEAERL